MLVNILSALSPMVFVWMAALVVFMIIEGVTVSLVSIWFCGGALVAMLTAGLGGPVWLQFLLFLVVSGVLLALLAPLVRRYITPHHVATNADRHIGKTALVTEEINNLQGTGAIRLDGVVWTARAEGDQVIPADTLIVVSRIAGSKAWVRPAQECAEA